ncbi:unnamed protein product [Caretta caretta]
MQSFILCMEHHGLDQHWICVTEFGPFGRLLYLYPFNIVCETLYEACCQADLMGKVLLLCLGRYVYYYKVVLSA